MKVTVSNKAKSGKVLDNLGGKPLDSNGSVDVEITQDQLDELREDRDLNLYIHKRRSND